MQYFPNNAWTLVSYAQNSLGFGVDTASIKWKQIKTEQLRLIFPDYYENKARLVTNYFDSIAPYVAYNLNVGVTRIFGYILGELAVNGLAIGL